MSPTSTVNDRAPSMADFRDFWRERLAAVPNAACLTADRAGEEVGIPKPAELAFSLKDETLRKLDALTAGKPFLAFAAMTAVLKICLFKHTGQSTLVVGSPPRRPDGEPDLGPGALPIVTRIEPNLCFREVLLQERQALLDAYSRQELPLAGLSAEMGLTAPSGRNPLFAIALKHEALHAGFPDLVHDLEICIRRQTGRIVLDVRYDRSRFHATAMTRFFGHALVLLDRALADTSRAVAALDPLPDWQRRQLLVEFNDTSTSYDSDRCIHGLFEDRACLVPDRAVSVLENRVLTYAALNRRAFLLASRLRAMGVAPDARVAVCADRSPSTIVGIMAALKAGAAFTALDPSYPAERLDYMLRDLAAAAVLTGIDSPPAITAAGLPLLAVEEGPLLPGEPSSALADPSSSLAYVVFTSGSTGTPKGVMVTHAGLVNFTADMLRRFPMPGDTRMLQFVSPSFDPFVGEVFPTLCAGACLVHHPDPGHLPPRRFLEVCERFQINRLYVPPAYLNQVTAEVGVEPVKVATRMDLLTTGGESLSAETAAVWLSLWPNRSRIANAYGPSESTVTATDHVVRAVRNANGRNNLTIGRPAANTQTYLFGAGLDPVPQGERGELCIGGTGLARGYQNAPGGTAEKFVPHPFAERPGSRLYCTGDHAMLLPDGAIHFLGRLDRQVKSRGFRIEPGEIESALTAHPAVRQALVRALSRDGGTDRLVAYLLTLPGSELPDPLHRGFRTFLAERLPAYMVPSDFIAVSQWPLTPSGKIDPKALPEPDAADRRTEAYVAPRNETESDLAAIWQRMFRREPIGVHDDFVELGGNSLMAFQLVSRIRDAFRVELPLAAVFEAPTIAGQATAVVQAVAALGGDDELSRMLDEIENMV